MKLKKTKKAIIIIVIALMFFCNYNVQANNGKHIVINNNVIDFYGYWENSYKHFLYKNYENPGKKYLNLELMNQKQIIIH